MIWHVLIALAIFHSVCWIGKRVWTASDQWRREQAKVERREQHLAHRNEQWMQAYQNRKARREAWVASLTPERRAAYEKVMALYDDL